MKPGVATTDLPRQIPRAGHNVAHGVGTAWVGPDGPCELTNDGPLGCGRPPTSRLPRGRLDPAASLPSPSLPHTTSHPETDERSPSSSMATAARASHGPPISAARRPGVLAVPVGDDHGEIATVTCARHGLGRVWDGRRSGCKGALNSPAQPGDVGGATRPCEWRRLVIPQPGAFLGASRSRLREAGTMASRRTTWAVLRVPEEERAWM